MIRRLFFLILMIMPVWAPLKSYACGSSRPSDETTKDLELRTLSRVPGAGVESLGEGSDLLLEFRNLDPRSGVIQISASLLCEAEMGIREAIAQRSVSGSSTAMVAVPLSRLDLPRGPFRFSGLLTFTATIRYSDGHVESAPILELYFHPQGNGFLVYGENHRNEQFFAGRLRPEDRVGQTHHSPRSGPSYSQSQPSRQAALKICVEQFSAFTDAGVGEEFWQSPANTARASRGAWVAIYRETTLIWVEFLGDGRGAGDPGSGCTSDLPDPPDPLGTYDYTFQIFTIGRVQDNTIDVAYEGGPILDWNFTRSLTGTGTHVVTFDPTNDTGLAFDVYMVGAYCQFRHTAGVSDETYRYRLMQDSSNNWVSRGSDTIMIGEDTANKKFIVAHETGHLLGDFATGNNNWKTVSSHCECYESASCPASKGSHSMTSKEISRCAVAEGFAHFYAAAVFNSHTDSSPYECWFHYYKPVDGDDTPIVNCELDWPDGPFDEGYLENNCGEPWAGMGTELDWFRTFWDILSDPPTAFTVEHVTSWLDSSQYWHDYFAYDHLDAAANAIGGDLDSKWDAAKTRNGVGWPGATVLLIDGFESEDTDCWSDQ